MSFGGFGFGFGPSGSGGGDGGGGDVIIPDTSYSEITIVNSAAYVVHEDDILLHVQYSNTGATTITIPSIQNVNKRRFIVKDAGKNAYNNNIMIVTEGDETIDNDDSFIIDVAGGSVEVYSDGINWHITY